MTAIFKPEGPLFRATEHAGGPWSPDMLQGSATTALMTREVERLADTSGFAVRRLAFDLWRPAGLRAVGVHTDMLRDGRKAKTIQVRLLDGDTEIGRCTALLTAQGKESPADPFTKSSASDAPPEAGTPPPAFAQKWSRYFQNVSVR
ncbi:MAG: thioesterase family protein, partial [Bradyrhizobium sp.]|nr:thioesterase family protein [Bradyrhizobium sp.]